jgi:galactose-1-phosphate uridylyltransferase
LKNSHLHFDTSIGVKKPESIRNKLQACPFCAREELTDLIEVDGPIILLKNKYPVLENAYQTVLIETDDCHGELSTYELPYLHKLLQFALRNWLELDRTGKYESVILYSK